MPSRRGNCTLFYQPQFDIRSGFLTGAEVLLRWNHPQRGFIPPSTFIPIAESDGFIIQLGEWLLRQACQQKQQWHQAGLGGAYRLAIDDFGTGHSSLGRVKLFPIDVIKIDRLFVRDLMSDPNDEAIVRAVAALGHTLDKEVQAEGVETEEQLHLLREIGCDTVQGYLTGRPMPPEEFEQILRTRERRWPLNGRGVQG